MLISNLLFFLIACTALVLSGNFVVRSLKKIAAFLKFSDFVIAFMIMAFSTSLPELSVGINAALAKNSELALGNVIGSNILDITLIIGIAVLLGRGIKVKSKTIKRDAWYMFIIALLPIILMLDGKLSRIDGTILIAAFLIYFIILLQERKEFRKAEDHVKKSTFVINIFIFAASLAALFFSADFVVKYALLLSIDFALPAIFIGLFLVAIGTSLPELAFETRAVLKKRGDMALGDAMGSVVFNSTGVLGVTALILPITAPLSLFLMSAIFMIMATFIFVVFIEGKRALTWKEGIALILFYIFFVFVEFYLRNYI